jgi:hypothetical protein
VAGSRFFRPVAAGRCVAWFLYGGIGALAGFGTTRQNDDRTAIQPYSLHASVTAAASNRSQSGMNLNAHDKPT